MKSNEKQKDSKKIKEKPKKCLATKIILITLAVLILIVIISVSLCYMFLLKTQKQITNINSQAIKNQEEIIEYGTCLKYEDILNKLVATSELYEGTNIQIFINDTLIGQNEEHTFNSMDDIKIRIETSTKVISFLNIESKTTSQTVWKVQDTKKPVLSGVQDKEITVGDALDIKSGITASDEIDGQLEVTVEGDFDNNKVGEYTLTAKAVDKNNNETTQSFKITVKEKVVQAPSTATPSTSNKKTSSSSSSKTPSSNSGNTSTNTSSGSSNGNSASTKEGRLALARAEAARVVGRIISSGMNKRQKAEAICNYITTTVDVQSDQSNEAYQTNYGNEAYAALILKKAACSGRCRAVTLLCDAAGLKSQHINAGQWTHQWNKVQIDDGSWIVIDAQIRICW